MGFQILDCTLRDGGYMNNWHFDKKMARESYRALSNSGVDVVEIGFRGNEKFFSKETFGLWRFSEDKVIQEVTQGIHGAKVAVMGDFGKIDIEDFVDAVDTPVDIVRLAVHKDNIQPCITLLEQIKDKGYEVSLNAMGYTSYTQHERIELVNHLKDSNIDYLYMADSYGSIFPDQIESLYEPLLNIPNIKLGFHPHNNLQMAFANTLEALKCGVNMIDCTLYGIGRAAGNLPSEVLILYLELSKGGKYNVIPLLNCVDTYLLPLRKKFEWGYQVPYMLSGMYKCHPNYAKHLTNLRQYNIEDICIAMEDIHHQNPIGYSPEILDNIIARGLIGGNEPESSVINISKDVKVPYINKHEGRDFLVLANGPNLLKYKDKINQFILKYDPIILGTNNLDGLFEPHYHAFTNKRRFAMYANTVSQNSKLMLSQYFDSEMIAEYTDKDRAYESIYYKDGLGNFDILNGVIQSNCRTTSILLLGISFVMGAERIFTVGMDGYRKLDSENIFFYPETVQQTNNELLIELHELCNNYIIQINRYLIEKGQGGVHILTPTGYRSFYKGIDNYL